MASGRSLWRHRDFLKLWGGETVSQFGSAITFLAIPLIAINQLHATPFQVGLLTSAEVAPFILVGLPAGVWVDRLRRRPILLAADVGRAAVLASVPVAHAFGALTLGQLYAVALTTGVLTVFFDVAYQSFLPALVERDELADGNAKLEISRSAAQIAGPGVAGGLIGTVGAAAAIVADAVSFLVSAVAVFFIRGREPRHDPTGPRVRMRTQIAEGMRYVWHHPLLRPIAMCTATSNLFSSMWAAVVVLFMVRTLHLKAGVIGLVFAAANVGFLIGAALVGRVIRRVGLGRVIVLSIGLGSPLAVFVPLAPVSSPLPYLIAGQFLFAVSTPVYNIPQVSLRQAICPDRLLGRMNATMRFIVWGTMPIGAVIGGFLGGIIGLRTTLFVAVGGMSVAFLFPLLSPVWRLREVPEPDVDSLDRAAAAAATAGAAGGAALASGTYPPPVA